MRTTLKRGFGRWSLGGDDDGSQVPPDARTRMSRYRQPDRPGRSALGKARLVLGWLLVLVLVVAAGLGGGLYLFFDRSVAATQVKTKEGKEAQRQLDIPAPKQATIAMVLGYDRRAGENAAEPSRSDTIMLVRADPRTKSISLMSFPRDMRVAIYCPGHSPYFDKINAAFSDCGPKGTVATVKKLTGLPINYLITVNFRGFKKVVNTLGGVWIDVDRRYFNDRSGPTGYATINLQPGYQRLTGGAALDFVRYRHTDSDLYRVARQQLFVQAFKSQVSKSFSVKKIPGLVGDITKNVEVGVGGGKRLKPKTVLSYALFAYGLPPGHFFQPKIEGLEGQFDLTTSDDAIRNAVQDFVTPDVAAPKTATAVALGQKVKTKLPKPERTTITVLNGNGEIGSAGNARYLLEQRSYKTLDWAPNQTGNAPKKEFHTKVLYDPALKGSKLAAKQVARLFGAADVVKMDPFIRSLGNGAMLVVIVGSTFHNTIAPVPQKKELVREAPHVRIDPSVSRDGLLEAQKKVDFPLLLPTAIEETSVADPEVPVRAYAIDKGSRAVRLVYRTGGRTYWGIEMTDWDGAPALAERNEQRKLDGRTFGFYYHGSKLHMIVLHRGKASYWVINTLLDDLSNETMIAIARGLRPLAKG